MHFNIIKSYRNVVAVCDSDILGKKFEEGVCVLEIKESFFKGEELEKDRVIDMMKIMSAEDATFNIVGKESVLCAMEAGIISEEGVKEIGGVPFALVLR